MAVDAVLPVGGELAMLFAGALAAGAIAGSSGPSLAAAAVARRRVTRSPLHVGLSRA
jgi:hypothetical protein